MGIQIILVDTCLPESISGSAICIFGLLRHENALCSREFLLQIRFYQLGCQCRTESHRLALRVENNAGLAIVKGVADFIQCVSEA